MSKTKGLTQGQMRDLRPLRLREMRIKEDLNGPQIAKKIGVPVSMIFMRLKEYKIKK